MSAKTSGLGGSTPMLAGRTGSFGVTPVKPLRCPPEPLVVVLAIVTRGIVSLHLPAELASALFCELLLLGAVLLEGFSLTDQFSTCVSLFAGRSVT